MPQPSKQRITFEMDPNLPLHYIHGFFGGPNRAGEIEINFFNECEALPGPRELTLTEDGHMLSDSQLDEDDEAIITRIRTVHTRAVLDPFDARGLARWLIMQADQAEGFNAHPDLSPYDDEFNDVPY